MKLEVIAYNEPLPHIPELSSFVQPLPKKDTLGVDNVYMINLERRPGENNVIEISFNSSAD